MDLAILSDLSLPEAQRSGRTPTSSRTGAQRGEGRPLDEVDDGIVALFQANGRTSYREIARRLEVSEGMVRARTRRLEADGIFKFQAVTDVHTQQPGAATAYVALKVEVGAVDRVAKALASLHETVFVTITHGRFNVIAIVTTPSRPSLGEVVFDRVARLVGVRRVDTWEHVEIYKHDNRLVPFLS